MTTVSNSEILKSNETMMTYIIGIKEDVSAIKEHLVTLNGRVGKHDVAVECIKIETKQVDDKVRKVENKIAFYMGVIAVLVFIGQILIDKFLI